MSLLNILYTILIGPLKLIFEVIFYISNTVFKSEGLSIIVLSFLLNILLLPLYNKAEELQNKENDIQKRMQPYIDHIKKTFKSDEQYMIINTYYRQNDYKPIYSLRSILSLLLEIPFFIAAYSFLSNLVILNGTSFLFIKDLSKPDALIKGINIIPILMTLINIISCIIYTKGKPFKSKIQLYLMALVFLILLYNAPSGLAFYYLLNNVFSLAKNVLLNIKNKRKILGLSLIAVSLICLLFMIKLTALSIKSRIVIIACLVLLAIVGVFILLNIKVKALDKKIINKYSFFLSSVLMCILTGLLIPSQVIFASPVEFVDTTTFINPLNYIFNTFLLSFGLFIVWFNVYYSLMSNKIKKLMSIVIWALVLCSLTNHLFFKNNIGLISYNLIYDVVPEFSFKQILINIITLTLVICLAVFVNIKYSNLPNKIMITICVVLSFMFGYNAYIINREYLNVVEINKNANVDDINASISLSKNEKNVVVIMLDRAISSYIPYILEEKSVLQEQFKGFTYYPNTISFGAYTNVATPALFGGYEYTPEEINKRDTELLVDKHNEALKVLPVLFDNNNYDVTVCDPVYANYSWIPDLSIYDEYPKINKYLIENEKIRRDNSVLNRNFFIYSINRICPTFLFSTIYGQGNYMDAEISGKNNQLFRASYETSYKELSDMIELTNITDSKSSFVMMINSATHGPIELQLPNYEFTDYVNNSNFEYINKYKKSIYGYEMQLTSDTQIAHYHANMYAMIELGKWFDYLRDNDVYDNTRIIIVSDHGRALNLDSSFYIKGEDMGFYNALLMVKDFNSEEFSIDDSFMTNADTPYLATRDIIDSPINPFTGNEISAIEKDNVDFKVFGTHIWSTDKNNGVNFIDDIWYTIHDNCLDISNWKIFG